MLENNNSLQLYTIKDVAGFLKVASRTIYNHIGFGLLKGTKIGSKWRFSEQQVIEYITKLQKKEVSQDAL